MTKPTEKRGFFRSALEALIDARSREAERIVARYEAAGNHGRVSTFF